MVSTLAEAIKRDRISFDDLHGRYKPVLQMVDVLIGVVPNCDTYLEVWRPGFRTYNLMVPNFLDLPASLFGRSAPKDIVGLGMYASSRAASCNYCSAQTCSFALRRGTSADAVTGTQRTPGEAATVAVAEALSYDQHTYKPALGDELRRHYSAADAEWIVMAIAMMGFLNKFMDSMGIELEAKAVGDVSALIGPTGWSIGQHGWADSSLDAAQRSSSTQALPSRDSFATIAQVLRNAPGALKLDRQFMDGMPTDAAAARERLIADYGYDEELLSSMAHGKPRRALAAMLHHNLDPRQSVLGIGAKAIAGLVYARHVANPWLINKSVALAKRHEIAPEVIASAGISIDLTGNAAEMNDRTAAIVAGASAMAPSPARVDATTLATVTDNLWAAEIVELAVWISICQLQHRLSLWYQL